MTTINPIEELLEKKIASRDKLIIQVEDAEDSVRRANNKLISRKESLASREQETVKLNDLHNRVEKLIEQDNEISEKFRPIWGISLIEWRAFTLDEKMSPENRAKYDIMSAEVSGMLKETQVLWDQIRELEALARKIYYNR